MRAAARRPHGDVPLCWLSPHVNFRPPIPEAVTLNPVSEMAITTAATIITTGTIY